MHSDHYSGLTPQWDEGVIYCSDITKILMQNMFPQIESVKGFPPNLK
jgi:hypothetical protein